MKIEIPTPLRVYTNNQPAVTVEARTVAQAVSALTTLYPDFQKHLYTPEGKLRSFVNLYLNDEDVRYLPNREETEVGATDTLSIIPSIAGGGPGLAVQAGAPAARDPSFRG
ncbi:MAG TPA: MoaD/ThiS family protein [Acidobacteriaceae bacterium]|jgi:adenylyltransferase/sulfurtransferase|nr:MoaD/ThiS family protein [Acidobacteriaceae bacterium]